MRKAEVARKFDEIVAFSGVEKFIDTPVKRYSSGMYVRLAFAVAAHLEPDVLIIDEVLAVGDAEFQKRCLGKMGDVAREGRTVIFVSHNMAAIQKLCTRAIWIRKGQVAGNGDPASVIDLYLDSLNETTGRDVHDAPGYLYRYDPHALDPRDARIISLQMIGSDDRPLREVGTWDNVRFRIEFESKRSYPSFAAELNISSRDGIALIRTSTSPDQNQPFGVSPGRYRVDCAFERLPLAQGEYQIGLGLAIPCIEYVWRNDNLCQLHVATRDVFASGKPPASVNYLIATPHAWSAPQSLLAQAASASMHARVGDE
jgi:lipopolysaccharide transport system ATP-binding protein